MQFSSSVASVAAGVIPVFLIAWLLEIQRIRLTPEEARRTREQVRGGAALVTGLKVATVLFLAFGAVLEVWMLVAVQVDGLAGGLAVITWALVGAYVLAPLLGVALSMFD